MDMAGSDPSPTPSAETDFAADFANFAAALDIESLPADVVRAAKANVSDILACAVAGVSADGVADVAAVVQEWGGKAEASIWCRGYRVPAHHAALVNGMMAHARDYDDTHDAAVLHAGVSVVPAAIAAAEMDPTATGADLVCGLVAGLELICRLGVATKIGLVESGFMYTSLFGHFAATAAAARVLRLDAATTANALGVAYSQAAGTHQVTRDGALTKRLQPGFAAQTGLVSVALARRGIGGTIQTFEGCDGLFRSYLRGRYDPAVLRDGLGDRFELLGLSYKPYPCCRFNHAAIDAALEIRRIAGAALGEVTAISCGVNNQAYEAVCTPVAVRQAPQSVVQAQFSLPFTVACALVKGAVGLDDFTSEGVGDPAVRAMARKVEAWADPKIERDWSRGVSPADLRVETKAGVFRARVDVPKGGPDTPLSSSDAVSKLADALTVSGLPWASSTAQRLIDGIECLERLPAAAAVIAPIAGARAPERHVRGTP
jgi:2-methylcitrate dehydratase PrpD